MLIKVVQRVERHIVVNDKTIDHICFLSKNLYNHCNFILKQVYYNNKDSEKYLAISDFHDLIKTFTIKDKTYTKIDEYDLSKRLAKLNNPDYRALPIQTSQNIISLLYKNWKSFFKSLKVKDKLNGKPKLPKYKDKIKGRNITIFTNQNISIKDGYIHFPKKSKLKSVKTLVKNIQQVRIIPQTTCYVIEVVYKKEVVQNENLNKNLYLGIDLGINNLATCVNNTGQKPFIVNGKIVKSINQYYNKKKALFQSFIGDKGISNRIRRLTLKRNNKIEDYFHKTSKFIIDYCEKHNIKTIIVGKNDGWKDGVNLGKKTNQKFVNIPHNKLILKLKYKAEDVGIRLIETEESYTSKCSFLDLEEMKHHNEYLGNRVNRGMFISSDGVKINADVNGAFNIIRKVVPEIFDNQGIEGLVLNPIIVKGI